MILKFRSTSKQDTERLGRSFAVVLEDLFNRVVEIPTDKLASVMVGLHAPKGTGKSAFTAGVLDGLGQGKSYRYEPHIATVEEGEYFFFEELVCESEGIQHRVYDIRAFPWKDDCVMVPGREGAGIDLVENADRLSFEWDCRVYLMSEPDESRIICMEFPQEVLSFESVQNSFLPAVQDLQLL